MREGAPSPPPPPPPPTHQASRGGAATDWASRVGVWARQLVNRVVFQIDEEQEARMRAYLDETYGSDPAGAGGGPVQMGALRPKRNVVRVAQPPSSHEEEAAQRLYETLEATNAGSETPGRKVSGTSCAGGSSAGVVGDARPSRQRGSGRAGSSGSSLTA